MGKGGKGDGPSFPNSRSDIEQLIRMQEDAMRRAAQTSAGFNFFDRFTPWGSMRYEGRPGESDFRQIVDLPEAEREALERSRAFRLGLQGLGEQQLGALGDIFTRPLGGDLSSAEDLERATFQRGYNLLQPAFERQSERMENQLIQRGIPRSSEAYGTESDLLSQQQGRALEDLALSSVGAGRQEQSRLLQADLARRAGILNELGALTMGTAPGMPAFQATPSIGVGAADIMGPLAAMQQNAATGQAGKAAGKGGLSTLGSAALMAGMGGKGGGAGGAGGAGKAGKGASPQVGSMYSPFGWGLG